MSEKLICVDEDDNILGYETKETCHAGAGILHRAFSIFVFNSKKQLLIQKRSALKPLWPLYWSNSVCSHPRESEKDIDAAHRRLMEEINIDTPLKFLFKFQYEAKYLDIGSENELCSVYIGFTDKEIRVDPYEIADWKYMGINELDEDVARHPETYSPWFKIEYNLIRKDFMNEVEKGFVE